MTASTFTELDLDESLLQALATKGYQRPTAIQAETIPRRLGCHQYGRWQNKIG